MTSTSPYQNTQTFNRYVKYLDIWQPPYLSTSSNDFYITLASKYQNRPDLLSYDLYGTPSLWWIFAAYNTNVLKDPIYDMKTGISLYIPNKANLTGML